MRARCEREPDLLKHGSGFVLYALMDAVVDRYFPVVEEIESELERVEQQIFAGAPVRASVEALYGLKQKLTALQHATRPMLEATGKLFGARVPSVCARTQEYYRDVYDHLQRINQSIDSLREMVNTATSVNLSLISLQENETTKRLAAYAALVAVPTLVAGAVRNELRADAGAALGARLPRHDLRDGGDRRLPVLPLPARGLAVTACRVDSPGAPRTAFSSAYSPR